MSRFEKPIYIYLQYKNTRRDSSIPAAHTVKFTYYLPSRYNQTGNVRNFVFKYKFCAQRQ